MNSGAASQLRQQFIAQFCQIPTDYGENDSMQASFYQQSFEENRAEQMERFRKAAEPLNLSEYGMKENDDMVSVGDSSSDFDTVCDSESTIADFESIGSSESGMIYYVCFEQNFR